MNSNFLEIIAVPWEEPRTLQLYWIEGDKAIKPFTEKKLYMLATEVGIAYTTRDNFCLK